LKEYVSNITEYLAAYISSVRYEDISSEAEHKIKALIIDTLACAIAGYDTESAMIARKIAGTVSRCDMPAAIMGSRQKSTVDLATFANGVAIRCLDFNDGYISPGDRGGGHPSDNFAPILTCADAIQANGKQIIVASIVAYEIFCQLSDKFTPASNGYDQAVIGLISSVAGLSRILRLSYEQIVQAINLAVSSNISLGQIREGKISMWKNCAVADAARNAVFATLLAREGMTGPTSIFEGQSGFFRAVSGPFQLDNLGRQGNPFRVLDVLVKRYPCGMVAQTAIDAAITLRTKISGIDEIAKIKVGTFTPAKRAMAEGPEKWHPSTRESADHSLPYVVAVSLMYGNVEKKHFNDKYLHDPALNSLLQKIEVEESEECNRLFPESAANFIEIITKGGKRHTQMVRYHRGHSRNFVSDEEIEEKFYSLTRGLIPSSRSEEIMSLIWNFENVENISHLMTLLEL
jgi:2-methylcitrate dehydratase